MAGAAEDQPGAHGVAEQKELRRELREATHWHQAGKPLARCNGTAKRDQAAEADTAGKDTAVAELADQQIKRCNLVVLVDEQGRLAASSMATHTEGRDPHVPT